MKTHRLSHITSALVLALGLSTSALANTTTSAIKGNISGPNGNAAVGTQITIVHVPSGTTKTATVNASGLFTAKGLRVGGPYKIIVDSKEDYKKIRKMIKEDALDIGDALEHYRKREPLFKDLNNGSRSLRKGES